MSGIDWTAIWGVVGPAVVGLATWLRMRTTNKARNETEVAKAKVEGAAAGAETSVIELMRQEVKRLGDRVAALESREGRLIRHVYRLEGLMRGAGIEPPPFDIDGDPIRAGGTE